MGITRSQEQWQSIIDYCQQQQLLTSSFVSVGSSFTIAIHLLNDYKKVRAVAKPKLIKRKRLSINGEVA
jgi:hypothetical protein